MNDSAIIDGKAFQQAVERVADHEDEALDCLSDREPVLASFIVQTLTHVAGKMALNGAPAEFVQGCHQQIMGVILISVEASRIAHYELWEEVADGEHLEKITTQNDQVSDRLSDQLNAEEEEKEDESS